MNIFVYVYIRQIFISVFQHKLENTISFGLYVNMKRVGWTKVLSCPGNMQKWALVPLPSHFNQVEDWNVCMHNTEKQVQKKY